MCATLSKCATEDHSCTSYFVALCAFFLKCHPSLLLMSTTCLFSQQLRSTLRSTTSVSSSPRTARRCVSWCSRTSRYVTSCGSNRSATAHLYANTSACTCWVPYHLLIYAHISWTRYLGARRCCRGSGDPWSARLRLRAWLSLRGSGRVQHAPRSNRSGLAVKQPGCWWWFSLSSPCATCQSACSMSWKGNLPWGHAASGIKSLDASLLSALKPTGLEMSRSFISYGLFFVSHVLHYLANVGVVRCLLSGSQWISCSVLFPLTVRCHSWLFCLPAESSGRLRTRMTERRCTPGLPSHIGSFTPTVQQIPSFIISSVVSLQPSKRACLKLYALDCCA